MHPSNDADQSVTLQSLQNPHPRKINCASSHTAKAHPFHPHPVSFLLCLLTVRRAQQKASPGPRERHKGNKPRSVRPIVQADLFFAPRLR